MPVEFWPVFKEFAAKLSTNQIRGTVFSKRNRAPGYQPKLGNEEPESEIHLRK